MLKKLTLGLMAFGLAGGVGCAAEFGDEDVMTTRAVEQGLTCSTNTGINPMKASLAVALAKEVGRVDPLRDLVTVGGMHGTVVLTNDAKNRCSQRGYGQCHNTQALLNLQDAAVNAPGNVPQHQFNATTYRNELLASFERQRNHITNLQRNEPHRVPGPHTLSFHLIQQFAGACGVHYEFNATGDVNNFHENLIFFGGTQNPFIDYRRNLQRIAIDPTATMNGDDDTSSNQCTVGCLAYTMSLRDTCCSCDGRMGSFKRSSWDRSMLYCAY